MTQAENMLSQWGGESKLRELVDRFVMRVAEDSIIGFFFQGRDLSRIQQHEWELALQHLLGQERYRGRDLAKTHRRLGINRGQLRRRHTILKATLREAAFPPELQAVWLQAERSLEQQIVSGGDCNT